MALFSWAAPCLLFGIAAASLSPSALRGRLHQQRHQEPHSAGYDNPVLESVFQDLDHVLSHRLFQGLVGPDPLGLERHDSHDTTDELDIPGDISDIPDDSSDSKQALWGRCPSVEQANSTWKRKKQRDGSEDNLCLRGKLHPQLYLLGSDRVALSFITQMVGAGVECAGSKKEFNFWERASVAEFGDDHAVTVAKWRRNLPWCDKHDKRRVVADFTTRYMQWVPKPNSSIEDAFVARVPWVLALTYGTMYKSMHFVVLLQNPLARMRSAFLQKAHRQVFATWATSEMRRTASSTWSGMYGFQLDVWTTLFQDSQFYMIPYRLFNGTNSELICKDLSARLKFTMACGQVVAAEADDPHMDKETRELWHSDAYQTVLMPDKDLLVNILLRGSTAGMGLAAYNSTANNHQAIKSWLERGW